jgi:hypothetical protein
VRRLRVERHNARVSRTAVSAPFRLGLAAMAALCVPALAAANGPTIASAGSGLYGHATKGPLTPVCTVAVPCYGPARHAKLAFLRNDRVVARAETNARGDYRIALRPGRYRVKSKVGMGVVKPAFVTVRRARFSRADLDLDTGIR